MIQYPNFLLSYCLILHTRPKNCLAKWLKNIYFPEVACGPVRENLAGSVKKVIVTGGALSIDDTANATSIVEIYLVENNTWIPGTEYLHQMSNMELGKMLPLMRTFLVKYL